MPNLLTGTVPLPKLVAFNAVKFTPLIAGSVFGKRESGIVPLLKLSAFNAVKFTPLIAGSIFGNRAFGIVPLVKLVAFNAVILVPAPLNATADKVPTSLIDAKLV